MAIIVVDDHLLRDIVVGDCPPDLGGLAADGMVTTGLWLFRLCSSFADPTVAGKLSAPVAALPDELQAAFRSQLTGLPPEIDVLPMRELAWLMAELQTRHRADGRTLSAAMVEALAAAHRLTGGIAVSTHDVGPNLVPGDAPLDMALPSVATGEVTRVATRAERFPQLFLGLVVLSVGFAIGASAVGDGLRARSGQEMITVTGSARKTIVSDTVVWRASVTSTQPTPAEASRELAAWVGRVRSFLRDAGAGEDEVRVDPVTTETIPQLAPDGRGDTGRVAGYRLSRAFEVRSSRVKELTDIVQKSSALLTEGIPLTAQPPQYRYAQLAKIRPDLLAEASRDAKTRGQRLVTAAGGRLGRLQSVSAGVIQITAPNATDTSGEGVYDTSTIEKDATAVVRLTFGLR